MGEYGSSLTAVLENMLQLEGNAPKECFFHSEAGSVFIPVLSCFFISTATHSLPFTSQFVARGIKTVVHSDLLWTAFIFVPFAVVALYK